METMLLRKNSKSNGKGDSSHEHGCIHKLIMFFTRNKRLMTKRRLTTDKDGNPIGSHKAPIHPDNIKKLKDAYKHPFEKISMEYYFNVSKET